MPTAIETLLASPDMLHNDLGRAMQATQDARTSRGEARWLGRDPTTYFKHGAEHLITQTVLNNATGFNLVNPEDSYEAIALKFPDRFTADVVVAAQRKIEMEQAVFAPTADEERLSQQVHELLPRYWQRAPQGSLYPPRTNVSTSVFLRDPRVRAYVLVQANGQCELCKCAAPFKDKFGDPYLETHHVKPLAANGSDTVSNSIALCPNCHREAHFSHNSGEVRERMYKAVARLKPE